MGVLDDKPLEIKLGDIKFSKIVVPLEPIIEYPPDLMQAAVQAMQAKIEADVLAALAVPSEILNAPPGLAVSSSMKPLGVSMIAKPLADVDALCMAAQERDWPVSEEVLRSRLAAEFGDTDPRT